jgi:SAM-dependent methyltransferase
MNDAKEEIDDGGWSASADAWIAQMGERGDKGRRYVLDPSLLSRIEGRGFRRALDVGCGEGRFCRVLAQRGIATTGIDPTDALLARAQSLDPVGVYLLSGAQNIPLADASFDLVITCLSLVDIEDYRAAIFEMARVLEPGGALVAANLTEIQSAGMGIGWQYSADGRPSHFGVDNCSSEWFHWVEWAGIRVKNWHRPLSAYMRAFLEAGLVLAFFDEPEPAEGYTDDYDKNTRAPWFNVMEWRKPG